MTTQLIGKQINWTINGTIYRVSIFSNSKAKRLTKIKINWKVHQVGETDTLNNLMSIWISTQHYKDLSVSSS